MDNTSKKKEKERRLINVFWFIIIFLLVLWVILIYRDKKYFERQLKEINTSGGKIGTYSEPRDKEYPEPWEFH